MKEKVLAAPEPWAKFFPERATHSRFQLAGILSLLILCVVLVLPPAVLCGLSLREGDVALAWKRFLWLIAVLSFFLLFTLVYAFLLRRKIRASTERFFYYDTETGSPGWPKWVLTVPKLLNRAGNDRYIYVYLDVKNFKYINDLYGYAVGDDLIRNMAQVIRRNLAGDEAYVRITADKFSMLLRDGADAELRTRLIRMRDEMRGFRDMGNMINVYFGIYRIADISMPLSQMSDRALLTMKRIKNSPRDDFCVSFYNEKYRQAAVLERELEGEMYSALENREFIIYLQPKFNLMLKQVSGAEALVRWQHPRRGMLPPGCFIDLFERNGMITRLDCYVFEQVCRMLARWKKEGRKLIPISVNLSRVALYNSNLPRELYGITKRFGIPTKYLEIELTESAALEDAELLTELLDGLKQYGFTLSIDDFGSGYSSLNILKDMSVDELKLDREFFSHTSNEERSQQVITGVVGLAKQLQMKTVAEGVEQKEQADFLEGISCDCVQGFYFSRPIPVEEFEEKYLPLSRREKPAPAAL